jgi:hypothetical protein
MFSKDTYTVEKKEGYKIIVSGTVHWNQVQPTESLSRLSYSKPAPQQTPSRRNIYKTRRQRRRPAKL